MISVFKYTTIKLYVGISECMHWAWALHMSYAIKQLTISKRLFCGATQYIAREKCEERK